MARQSKYLRFSRIPTLFTIFLIAAPLIALAAPMNFVLMTPGPATPLFPKVLTVKNTTGIKSYPVNGQLNLLTIYITNPESRVFGAEVVGCWIWGDCVVMPRSVMYEDGATDEKESKNGTQEMVQSQNIALAAARSAISRNFPTIDLGAVSDSSIKVSLENTGGPSGGLVFTLGLIDLFTPVDLLQGRNIAGTGTISKDGSIGAIGGVTEKILGAKKAGASILFVSQENCSELPSQVEGITVIAIEKIDEAVKFLSTPISGGGTGKKGLNSAGIRGCASVGA